MATASKTTCSSCGAEMYVTEIACPMCQAPVQRNPAYQQAPTHAIVAPQPAHQERQMLPIYPPTAAPRAMQGVNIISGTGAKKVDFDTWQDKAYRICCVLLIVFGVFNILAGTDIIHLYPSSSRAYYGVVGGVDAFFGYFLLQEAIWAQFIMKWRMILLIVDRGLGLLTIPLMMSLNPGAAVVMLLVNLVMLSAAGLMLYLLITVGDV